MDVAQWCYNVSTMIMVLVKYLRYVIVGLLWWMLLNIRSRECVVPDF